jgi:hypothetical protein
MEVVVLLGLAALLGLLVLLGTQVNRELRALRDSQASLASQVILVRQEIQVLRGHLEALATAIAGRTLRDIRAQVTIPDRGTAREEAKERTSK